MNWNNHPHVPQQYPPVYSQQPGAVYPNTTYPSSNPQVVYMQQPAQSSSGGSTCCALCCGMCCGAVCAECCSEILCCCCQACIN